MTGDYPLEVKGCVKHENGNLRVYTSLDFIMYYKWHLERQVRVKFGLPMHQAHLTIVNKKIHGVVDTSLLENWNNTQIIINYSPYIFVGAQTKNYRIFMLRCHSNMLDYIANDLNVSKPHHWHFTIANTKNGTRPYIL